MNDITRTRLTDGGRSSAHGGFPASLSVMPGDEEARRMTATSGRQCIAPSTKSSPLGLWLRTLLESSRWSSRARFLRWRGSATFRGAFDDLRGRYELRETFTLQRICTDLESHGYAVQPVLVPACAVGAPHRRDRVFIVARDDVICTTADKRTDRESRERCCEER